jgi:hypothetical protein
MIDMAGQKKEVIEGGKEMLRKKTRAWLRFNILGDDRRSETHPHRTTISGTETTQPAS